MEVFYSSPWVPREWIEAHGLEPRGLWLDRERAGVPLPLAAGVCAFSESIVRCTRAQAESAAVFTTTCDQMRRAFDELVHEGRERLFLLNLPATWQSPASRRLFAGEVERLGRFLEALGGRAPSSDTLSQVLTRSHAARSRLREAAPHCPARPFAEAVARFHGDGSVNLPNQARPPRSDSVPLALIGGPLPASQWAVLDAIERAGGRLVLNATDTGERGLLPSFLLENLREDPLGVLLDGYFDRCVDVFHRPNTRLYAWLKPRLAERAVRGLVLFRYVGCDLWSGEAQSLREALGLPLLMLGADDVPTTSLGDLGRIQAFVEMLT